MTYNYSTYSNESLLLLIKQSDEAAFTELYNRYWERLFGVAAFKLGNPSEAEELVQDLFLDLWNRREIIDIQRSVTGYFSVALNYRVLNIMAKRHRHAQYQKTLPADTIDGTTREYIHFEELKEKIEKLAGELPEKCQLVFRLSRNEELSHREIANYLDISEKTVESHLTRALRFLKTGLGLFSLLF